MTVETINLASIPARFSKTYLPEIVTLTTDHRLIGMSPDGTKIYARGLSATADRSKTVYESADDGDTWTAIKTFAFNVEGMSFLENGEVVVVCQGGTATPGYLYISSNWAANPSAATWRLSLTTQSGYIRSVWGMHQWSHAGNYMVTCEYGGQTDANADQSAKATKTYWSEDLGVTWKVILDLTVMFPGVVNLHNHAVAYDKKWDRIWFTYGDASNHLESDKSLVMYSDDHGETWNSFTVPTEWAGAGTFQSTTIALTEESILLMPDGVPYATKTLMREGYRKQGGSRIGAVWAGNTGAQGISFCAFKAKHISPAPMFLTTQGASANVQALILVNPSGKGEEWIEIFRDTTNNTSTVHFAVGPTAKGNLLFAVGNTLRRSVYNDPYGPARIINVNGSSSMSTSSTTTSGTQVTRLGFAGSVNGDDAALWVPRSAFYKRDVKLVIACHGLGATHTWMDAQTGPQGLGRQHLLDNGYLVMSHRMHGDSWGNATAQADIKAAYDLIVAQGWNPQVVLLGESMGGGAAAAAYARKTVPYVMGTVLIAPLLNYTVAPAGVPSSTITSFNTAYGAANETERNTNSEPFDPMRRPTSDYANAKIWFASSPDDTVVPRSSNTSQFLSRIGSVTTNTTDFVTTGGHVSAQHWNYSGIINFVNSLTAVSA